MLQAQLKKHGNSLSFLTPYRLQGAGVKAVGDQLGQIAVKRIEGGDIGILDSIELAKRKIEC